MGGLYSRVKTWTSTEDVSSTDLNAEFDNILNNFVPLMLDDYSTNVTQMRVTADPGESGSESLATSLAGELARIRQLIVEITGKTYWYETPAASISGLVSALGSTLVNNRLSSGRVRTTSEFPIFLVPNGAARTVTVKGATTSFIYYISGTAYTISTDVNLTSLTAAPSSNNTCLVNDANASDQEWTKHAGEGGTEITIDTVGSEISALAGKLAAFKLDNGTTTEMFIAEVGTTKLFNARRGYFFNSSDTPQSRISFANNDTITLLKLSWIFAKTDGTLAVTYTNPTWSKEEPSSPSANDYWYDLDNDVWKRHDGSSFSAAGAILIGVCCQDTTATLGARSFEFSLGYDELNTMEIIADTNAQVRARSRGSQISVWGSIYRNDRNYFTWEMGTHLDSGLVEGSSTYYYFYITEDGGRVISDVRPYDQREQLKGYYHPHHSWRCVGFAYNNGSSNLESVNSYFSRFEATPIAPVRTASTNVELIERVIPVNGSGGAFTEYLPPAAYWKGSTITYFRVDQTLANQITLDFSGSEVIYDNSSRTTYKLCTKGESVTFRSDGTSIFIVSQYIPSLVIDAGVITIAAVSGGAAKGTTVTDNVSWWREGRWANLKYLYSQSAGGTAGTGAYLISLPTGMTADSAIIPVNTTASDTVLDTAIPKSTLHSTAFINNGSNRGHGLCFLYSTSQFRAAHWTDASTFGFWGSVNFSLSGAATLGWSAVLRVPISGWEG